MATTIDLVVTITLSIFAVLVPRAIQATDDLAANAAWRVQTVTASHYTPNGALVINYDDWKGGNVYVDQPMSVVIPAPAKYRGWVNRAGILCFVASSVNTCPATAPPNAGWRSTRAGSYMVLSGLLIFFASLLGLAMALIVLWLYRPRRGRKTTAHPPAHNPLNSLAAD
jgi:hypothetical protein